MKNKFLETGEQGYHPLRKFKIILSGLRYAVLHDFSVLYKIVISLLLLIPVMIYREWIDASIILLATGFMIAGEIFNTAIEAVCDFMETRYNEKIKIIKDISAAAAGITIFVWMAVLVYEFFKLVPHLR
jgi:diacylglycerol kinase (ATP)